MHRIRLIIVAVLALCAVVALPEAIAAAQDGETVVGGTIRERDAGPDGTDLFIEGVSIDILTADGELVETATTNADGEWSVTLPAGGNYQASINVDSLPAGVNLKNPDKALLEFEIKDGATRKVLFPVESDAAAAAAANEDGPGDNRFAQLTVDGIKFGMIIAMSAIGLSLIYGTTGLTNFAHGEMVTLGATLAFLFNVTGVFGWRPHLIIAGIAAMVLCGLFGGLFDRFVWLPLRNRGTSLISMLVVSLGISILLRYITLYQFGGRAQRYSSYTIQKAIDFGPFSIPPKDIWLIGISAFVLGGVGLLLQKTRIGKAMRAVADNRDLAESSGIDVESVIRIVWIAGGALAGLGGVLFGLTETISWDMGFRLLLLMFAGVTVGGLGTAYGALFGSILVGIFIQWSTLVVSPDLKNFGALLALVVVLLVRPQGLLGRAERIG